MTTPKPDVLLELAERCEAATGPDLKLERDIRKALGLYHSVSAAKCRFTRSLDAAMTLVPEGVSFAVGKGIETELGGSATDYAWCGSKAVPHEGPYAWAATPALALCAAALRARAKGVSR